MTGAICQTNQLPPRTRLAQTRTHVPLSCRAQAVHLQWPSPWNSFSLNPFVPVVRWPPSRLLSFASSLMRRRPSSPVFRPSLPAVLRLRRARRDAPSVPPGLLHPAAGVNSDQEINLTCAVPRNVRQKEAHAPPVGSARPCVNPSFHPPPANVPRDKPQPGPPSPRPRPQPKRTGGKGRQRTAKAPCSTSASTAAHSTTAPRMVADASPKKSSQAAVLDSKTTAQCQLRGRARLHMTIMQRIDYQEIHTRVRGRRRFLEHGCRVILSEDRWIRG